MPVFQETANTARDLRVNACLERPLPRLVPRQEKKDDGKERYEVVVIGAGPAGMLLTLMLARLGLGDSLACFDSKAGTLKAGQADGLQPRTLEVLKSLDIAHEILEHGCHMSEVAFWNPKDDNTGIERTSFVPDVVVASRYKHEVTIHQGRIERIMEENLQRYSPGVIHRSSTFIEFCLDSSGDADYPVSIEVDQLDDDGSTQRKVIRAKYLVGADGAHSEVRRCMGLTLEGDTTDHIWGVVDFVADTDFPDIRKRCAIHSNMGSVMVIPRERISTGAYLSRLYVQVKDEVPLSDFDENNRAARARARDRRAKVTLESIMSQAEKVFSPFKISIKKDSEIDWWAAYQIGQRLTSKFAATDNKGVERVFIVGDACHTHSPKAGQGMNVSMMDSYNLAWKLSHTIHGLAPSNTESTVLNTFEHERLTIARQLIEFDTKFSTMFSGQIGSADSVKGLTHEQFLKVFSDGSGFTSGCGVEYPPSILTDVEDLSHSSCIKGNEYLSGIIKPGRRLLDSVVKRYADSNVRHLQDDFLSTGRYRILVFTSKDLKANEGTSSQALEDICRKVIPKFPSDTIELVVLHCFRDRDFEWENLPACLKEFAEMSFHGPLGDHALYETYGVSEDDGAVVAVRPDGYVGAAKPLEDTAGISKFFNNCLVRAL